MQITLKQHEIEQALKQYIVSQGITLTDRDVDINFTAGRRGSGLSADLQISEDPTPVDYTAQATNDPWGESVPQGVRLAAGNVSPVNAVAEEPEPTPDAEEEDTADEDQPVAAKGGSLFGN